MAAEAISRRMTEARIQPELVVVDLRRVARVDRGGVEFLTTLAESLSDFGGALALSAVDSDLRFEPSDALLVFGELDEALEWCEDELLDRVGYNEGRRRFRSRDTPCSRRSTRESSTGSRRRSGRSRPRPGP